MMSFLDASRLARWNTVQTVLDSLSFKCHRWKYWHRVNRSGSRADCTSSYVLPEKPRALSSAYIYCLETVNDMSAVYILNSIGASTEPCGSPFLNRRFLLQSPLDVSTTKVNKRSLFCNCGFAYH